MLWKPRSENKKTFNTTDSLDLYGEKKECFSIIEVNDASAPPC